MKALIKVGYGCNDHCSFCHTLDVRHVDAEAKEVHAKIERAKVLGHSMVVLSGGEPTIRPELLAWAGHVASLDMDFGLVTNGRMLSYPGLVGELLERRLRYVYLSLHGGSAKVHNLMVRSEAFEQSYGALKTLSGHGLDFTVNCVVTRHNVQHLRGLVDAVLPYPDVKLKFSMVEPKGGGFALFEHLMPRVSLVAEKVKDAIRYGRERAGEGAERLSHGAIPLCLLDGLEGTFDDLKTHEFATMIEVGEPDFYPVDDLNKVQPEETCRGCSLSGPCPGLYRGYYEHFGSAELSPRRDRPRSNSFHYVFESLVSEAATACPLREQGVTPWDRGRHLFVRHGGRVARFRTHTRDFSDAELEAIKHEHGQLYLDVSKKDAPDDFAADLKPLVESAWCDGCPERGRCTGMFEPRLDDDVFIRDDARLADFVAELTGDILDIGCGEGRYRELLASKIAAGEVRYTALDPDREALARLAEKVPGARVEEGSAERWAARAPVAAYDHVLVLRSWNHLADPEAVGAAVLRALRPGGTLLVVDDAAFALARTPAQARRAERSTSAFEHYRNDLAADSVRILEPLGAHLLERRDASPETSTLWWTRWSAPAADAE